MESQSKQIPKSKRKVRTAFLTLLKNSTYEEISVTELVSAADIARATFYLHFNSKEEVLLDYVDEVFNNFFDKIEASLASGDNLTQDIAELMFTAFSEEPEFSQILLHRSIHPLLLGRFKGYLSRIVGRIAQHDDRFTVPDDQLTFLVDYWAGGSFQLIVRWIEQSFEPDARSMAEIYYRLTLLGMKSLLGEQT